MTLSEIKTAERLLSDRTERTERAGLDDGGYCLTAHWQGGGQKLFYALSAVAEYVAERERAEGV